MQEKLLTVQFTTFLKKIRFLNFIVLPTNLSIKAYNNNKQKPNE